MKHGGKKKKARYRKKEDTEDGLSNIGDTPRRNKISIIGIPRDERISQNNSYNFPKMMKRNKLKV